MRQVDAAVEGDTPIAPYPDRPNRSPWIAQLRPDGPPRPLDADADDGRGDRGCRDRRCRDRVLHAPRDRPTGCCSSSAIAWRAARPVGTPASSRPTSSGRSSRSPTSSGPAMAIEGQRAFDDAHDLLDLMAAETGATVRIERFTGHMGMFSLNHLQVHLRNNLLRRDGGLRQEACVVSEDAEFLTEIPAEFAGLYTVVPQARDPRAPRDRRRPVPRRALRPQGLRQQRPARPAGPRVPRAPLPGPLPIRRPDPRRADRRRRRRGRPPRRRAHRDRVAGRAVHERLRRPRRRGRRPATRSAWPRTSGSSARVGYMAAFVEEEPRTPGGDELHPQRDDRRRHAVRLRDATDLRPARRAP